MFMREKVVNGKVYAYLYEAYRDEAGKPKQKLVKSFGRVDLLDPKEYAALKRKYSDENKQETKSKQKNLLLTEVLNALYKASTADSESSVNKLPLLHYGHLLLKPLWEQLGLSYKINYLQKQQTEITAWSLSDLAFYISSLKLISPTSYLKGYEAQTSFLDNPVSSIALDNYYEGLDYLAKFKDEILEFITKKRQSARKQAGEVRLLMYDCTNCYFETPLDDRQLFRQQMKKKVRTAMFKDGFSEEQIQKELESESFNTMLQSSCEEHEDEMLRFRGPSKESRFAQPLISIALVIDSDGYPIDFEIYKGNSSEFSTMENSIKKLQEKYKIKHSYVVADRGLNSAANLYMLQQKKLGFVVAQKVSNLNEKLEAQMLDIQGYKSINIASTDLDECVETIRYKVCDIEKKARIENSDGQTKYATVKCKVMFTFSEKRRRRDLEILNEKIVKANAAVHEAKVMTNPCSSGWRALVKTIKEAQEGEIDKDLYKAKEVNVEVVQKRRQLAGYSAIVYADPCNSSGPKISEDKVLSTYHHLLKVEECFRCMKNNFSIRPMYVRLGDRIKGHCLLCTLALIMLRTLEQRLKKQNIQSSVNEITTALSNATVAVLPVGAAAPLFLNTKFYEDIYTHATVKPGREKAELNTLIDTTLVAQKFEKTALSTPDLIDEISNSVGLKPLSWLNNAESVRKALRIKTSALKLLDPSLHKVLEKLPAL